MIRFSANISMLFTELPLEQRFAAAANAGFHAVECWFPYDLGAERVRGLLADNDLAFTGLNTRPGSGDQWGIAALPGQEAVFRDSFARELEFADAIGAGTLHIMAGLTGAVIPDEAERSYLGNLDWAVRHAEGSRVRLVIEPLNGRDRPGYFLRTVENAARTIDRFGTDRLGMMFDCYHVQMEQGDVARRLEANLPRIAHVQIAAVPGRGEPDHGEVDYRWQLSHLDGLGWQGWVGAEYRPRRTTSEGLSWRQAISPGAR